MENSTSQHDSIKDIRRTRMNILKRLFELPKGSPEYEELSIEFKLTTKMLRDKIMQRRYAKS